MSSISKIRRNRPLLGTFVEITAFVPQSLSEDVVADAVSDAYKNIERLELILSKQNSASALSKLNASGCAQNPPQELFAIIKISHAISRLTKGLFDITAAAQLVGSYHDIFFSKHEIKFLRDLQIDLGGVAKGYIVDLTAKFLQQRGIKDGVVNAGGDIRFFGEMSHPIHVRNPFDPANYLDFGTLSNCSIASSSITQQSKERGGKSEVTRHQAILSAQENQQNLVHATTISAYKNYSCTIADALTKPLLLGWKPQGLNKLAYSLADDCKNFTINS